jgi:hypothetical protein
MFNWLNPKRLGIWKDDRLFDSETGVLMAEVLKNDKNLFYNCFYVDFPRLEEGIYYLSKENAMIAAEKKYRIENV